MGIDTVGRVRLYTRAGLAVLVASVVLLATSEPASAANIVSLRVSPTSKVVRSGRSVELKAFADYDDGTLGVDVTTSIDWVSTDPSVATVAAGSVTGVDAGTTTIRARDAATNLLSDPSASIRVVETLSSISLTPTERILPIPQGTQYHAVGTFEGGTTLEINNDVTWVLSDPSIARIGNRGKARGLQPGVTMVTATDDQTGISSPGVPLQVENPMQNLEISPSSIALPVGDTGLVKARALFTGDCRKYNYGNRLNWTSSNPAVATVNREGEVNCLSEGTSILSVRDRRFGVTSTDSGDDGKVICGGTLVKILVSPVSWVLPVGLRRDLEATYVFADGQRADGSSQVVWSSSDPSVAKITVASGKDEGETKALAKGQAIITAFDPVRNVSSNDPGGQNGVIDVPGDLLFLAFNDVGIGGTLTVPPSSTRKLIVRAHFEDGLSRAVNQLLAWSSSDENVVSFPSGNCDPVGTTDFLLAGTATVSVTYPKTGGPGSTTATLDVTVEEPGSPSRAFLQWVQNLLY